MSMICTVLGQHFRCHSECVEASGAQDGARSCSHKNNLVAARHFFLTRNHGSRVEFTNVCDTCHAPAPKPNFETLCKTKSIKKMVCAKDSKDLWPQRWHNHFTIFIAMFIAKIVRLAPCSHALAALRFALSIVDKTFEN